jgi:hypothetical protein
MRPLVYVATNAVQRAAAERIQRIVGISKFSVLKLEVTSHMSTEIQSTALDSRGLPNMSFWKRFKIGCQALLVLLIRERLSGFFRVFRLKENPLFLQMTDLRYRALFESHFAVHGRPSFILIGDDSVLSLSAVIQSQARHFQIPVIFVQTYYGVREEFQSRHVNWVSQLLRLPSIPLHFFVARSLHGRILQPMKSALKNYTIPIRPWLRAVLLGFPPRDPFSGYLGYCYRYLLDDIEEYQECRDQFMLRDNSGIQIENILVSVIRNFDVSDRHRVVLVVLPKLATLSSDALSKMERVQVCIQELCHRESLGVVSVAHPSSHSAHFFRSSVQIEVLEEAFRDFEPVLAIIFNSGTFRIFEELGVPLVNFDIQGLNYTNKFGCRDDRNHIYTSDLMELQSVLNGISISEKMTVLEPKTDLPNVGDVLCSLSLSS